MSPGNYKDWPVGALQEMRQQTLEVATKLHVYNQLTFLFLLFLSVEVISGYSPEVCLKFTEFLQHMRDLVSTCDLI